MSQAQLYMSESLSTTRQTLLESFRWKLKFNLSSATLKSQLSRIKHCSTLAAHPNLKVFIYKNHKIMCAWLSSASVTKYSISNSGTKFHCRFHKIQVCQGVLASSICLEGSRDVHVWLNLCALPVLFVSFNSLSHLFVHVDTCLCLDKRLLSKDKRTDKLTFVQICQRMQKMQINWINIWLTCVSHRTLALPPGSNNTAAVSKEGSWKSTAALVPSPVCKKRHHVRFVHKSTSQRFSEPMMLVSCWSSSSTTSSGTKQRLKWSKWRQDEAT